MKIRASQGTALKLNRLKGRLAVEPTTLYLMTYHAGKCSANCGFCSQARSSYSKGDKLSRVVWPLFELEELFKEYDERKFNSIRRVCIQTINYKGVFEDLVKIINYLKNKTSLPISVSIKPLGREEILILHGLGVDKICFPVDAATKELFEHIKGEYTGGPYRFENHLSALSEAVEVFGKFNVTTHLILGLGETEGEAANFMLKMKSLGVYVGLFALTPVKGTPSENFKPPRMESYRRVQLLRFLIFEEDASGRLLSFDELGELKGINIPQAQLSRLVDSGSPFLTSGCPGCNRPFYNERISGPIYNYPSAVMVKNDINIIKSDLRGLIK